MIALVLDLDQCLYSWIGVKLFSDEIRSILALSSCMMTYYQSIPAGAISLEKNYGTLAPRIQGHGLVLNQ